MAVLCSVLCLWTVFILYNAERKGKIKFTPVFSLGLLYSAIMLFVAVYDVFTFDHYKMSAQVPLFSLLFIFLFWIVGKIMAKLFRADKSGFVYFDKSDTRLIGQKRYGKILSYFLLLCLSILLINFILTYGFRVTDTVELKAHYSSGIISHVVNLCSILFLAVSADDRGVKFKILFRLASVLWALALTLFNAKYTMFMYAVALLIIYTIRFPRQFTFKRIFLFMCVIALAFFATYIFRFLLEGESLTSISYGFIFGHFVYYISGGFYAFSSMLEVGASATPGVGVGVFFAPLLNIVGLFTGQDFVSSTSAFIKVELPGGYTQTNVYTIFGSIWLEMGFMGVVLCIVLLAMLVYTIYFRFLRSRNKYMIALFAYACATLVFGFFNCFYGMLNIWEYLVGLWLLSEVNGVLIRTRKNYATKYIKVRAK